MKVAIVKYNAGNIRSVVCALNRLDIDPIWTDDVDELSTADRVIFPGVGEANTAMSYLSARGLDRVITELQAPVLGICLGLQLMCKHSEENDTKCLGIFPEVVRRFEGSLKIPHIGWNSIINPQTQLFKGVDSGEHMYFVHSYFAEESTDTIAVTDYCNRFSSALQRDNFYGVQFHPEKSGKSGAIVLENFINLA